jgi:hypothetical protein
VSDNHKPRSAEPNTGSGEVVVERSFVIAGSPDQAWEKLVQLAAQHDQGPGSWWLPGFRCRADEVAAVPGRRLEVIKAEQPCQDTTVVFTLEHVDTGTRIQVTQSGFDPAFVDMAGDDFWAHGAALLDEVERFFLGSAASAAS